MLKSHFQMLTLYLGHYCILYVNILLDILYRADEHGKIRSQIWETNQSECSASETTTRPCHTYNHAFISMAKPTHRAPTKLDLTSFCRQSLPGGQHWATVCGPVDAWLFLHWCTASHVLLIWGKYRICVRSTVLCALCPARSSHACFGAFCKLC